MANDNFYLDMENINSVIDGVKKAAEIMEETRTEFQQRITDLTAAWIGESKEMFEIRSNELMRKLTDVSQSFYDIGEDLQTAGEIYMQFDTEAAKATEGVSNRY